MASRKTKSNYDRAPTRRRYPRSTRRYIRRAHRLLEPERVVRVANNAPLIAALALKPRPLFRPHTKWKMPRRGRFQYGPSGYIDRRPPMQRKLMRDMLRSQMVQIEKLLRDQSGYARTPLTDAVLKLAPPLGRQVQALAPWVARALPQAMSLPPDTFKPEMTSGAPWGYSNCLGPCGAVNYVSSVEGGCSPPLTCNTRYSVHPELGGITTQRPFVISYYFDDGTVNAGGVPQMRLRRAWTRTAASGPDMRVFNVQATPDPILLPVVREYTGAPLPVAPPFRRLRDLNRFRGVGLIQGLVEVDHPSDLFDPSLGRAPSRSGRVVAPLPPGAGKPPVIVDVGGEAPAGEGPPDGSTRERKGRIKQGLALGLGFASEARDIVEAIYKALPKRLRKARNSDTYNQLAILWRHADDIKLSDALVNLIANEIEDRMVGRALGRTKRYYERGKGSSLSAGEHNALYGYYLSQGY